MRSFDDTKIVSDQTQAVFQGLVAQGADLAGLLALISSAYADGGNHVLDQLHDKMTSDTKEIRST